MKWVTRERPKIDRVACPWLISRFIDKEPEFLFVPAKTVHKSAEEMGAIAYDVPGVALGHVGDLCSFDAFIANYDLKNKHLSQLALIVRAADTGHLEASAQAPGLLAVSLGLSAMFQDDHEMLQHGFIIYDALFAWLKNASHEKHSWLPTP